MSRGRPQSRLGIEHCSENSVKTTKPRVVSICLAKERVNIVFMGGKKRGQGACENTEAVEEPTALREAFDPQSGQSLGKEGNASVPPAGR